MSEKKTIVVEGEDGGGAGDFQLAKHGAGSRHHLYISIPISSPPATLQTSPDSH